MQVVPAVAGKVSRYNFYFFDFTDYYSKIKPNGGRGGNSGITSGEPRTVLSTLADYSAVVAAVP